jgi:hypothetical protein
VEILKKFVAFSEYMNFLFFWFRIKLCLEVLNNILAFNSGTAKSFSPLDKFGLGKAFVTIMCRNDKLSRMMS